MTAQPVLLMIAGPNGSGKSTLTRQLRADGVDLGTYINPDEIATKLLGTDSDKALDAQRIAEEKRQECLAQRVSFSFETVMSHPSKIALLQQARDLGYYAVMFFVSTETPELNVARVRQRVALGGHPVPEDRIVSRYHRTLKLLPNAVVACDRAVLFDNTYRHGPKSYVRMKPFAEFRRDRESYLCIFSGAAPLWAEGTLKHLAPRLIYQV